MSTSASKRHGQTSDESLALTEEQVVQTLYTGKIEEKGLLPYSSNTSFLIVVSDGQRTIPAVYKPQRGENPLWDFEWGTLCHRETAAYEISSALGWRLIPPTVLREGTRGLGSVQFYIQHDPNIHYFTIQADARFASSLRQLSLFDFIVNNADRKSGHCLVDGQQQLWAIDHGICFHTDYKLRTVIWEFSGEPIESELLADLTQLHGHLCHPQSPIRRRLCALLSEAECEAIDKRLHHLTRAQEYPAPHPSRRNYPWPPV